MANQTRIININGMTCGGCVASVHNATADIDGLNNMSIELADNQATVTFDDSKTSVEAIAAAIDDAALMPPSPIHNFCLLCKKPAIRAGFLIIKNGYCFTVQHALMIRSSLLYLFDLNFSTHCCFLWLIPLRKRHDESYL